MKLKVKRFYKISEAHIKESLSNMESRNNKSIKNFTRFKEWFDNNLYHCFNFEVIKMI